MQTEPMAFPFSEPDRLNVDPRYAELRGQPLRKVQLPYGDPAWLVTRYEDARLVLGDPRFSRAAAADHDEPGTRAHRDNPDNIMCFDPPEHTRLRGLVAKAFTVRRAERLRPHAQEIADELVDRMLAKGPPSDLSVDFAVPFPNVIACELLGIPPEDRGEFEIWCDAYLSTTKFTPEQVAEYIGQLRQYVAGMIEERRKEPKDDLLSALVAARDEGNKLTEPQLLSLSEATLIGNESAVTQILNFTYALLTHPDQLEILRASPDRIPGAVEELLRFAPSGNGVMSARYALEDVELGGVTVRAGEPVVVSPASANHDESVFTSPERLDVTRNEASQLGLGHGPHHCLGAQLVRMELQVALQTLLWRLPGLRFAGSEEDTVWRTGLSSWRPARLEVAWDQP